MNGRLSRQWTRLTEGFDRPWKKRLYGAALALLCFLYPFSLAFVAGGLLPRQYAWTASVVIVLNGVVVLLSELRARPIAAAVTQFAVLSVGLFFVELVGVRSGIPFGTYAYTGTLGFSVLGVPVAIAIAWYATVMNTWRIARGTAQAPRWGVLLGVGLLTLALDLALEPMASIVNDYWIWEGGSAPVQNYISWVFLSIAAVMLLSGSDMDRITSRTGLFESAVLLYVLQLSLFLLTNVLHGHVIHALLSVMIAGSVFAARGVFSPRGTKERPAKK